jgi:hypothetical protein
MPNSQGYGSRAKRFLSDANVPKLRSLEEWFKGMMWTESLARRQFVPQSKRYVFFVVSRSKCGFSRRGSMRRVGCAGASAALRRQWVWV